MTPNPKQNAKPEVPPMATTPPRDPAAIRMSKLYLGTDRWTPLHGGTMSAITAGPSKNHSGAVVEIQYEPWIRHHRVREIEDGKVRAEFLVHEHGVIAVPEPGVASDR